MTTERLTILLCGMIASVPRQGGATWAVLQYLLGLRRLGHEVYFVEPVEESALDPSGAALNLSENAKYLREVAREFGLEESASLLLAGTRETVGLSYDRLLEAAARADLLINISGMLTDEDLLARAPVRVYLDIDPAFNQLWHAAEGIDMRFGGHTHFVTIGQAIGQPSCPVPTCGLRWIKTLQPVVLEHWPVAEHISYDALTTIANWRGYGSVEYQGVFYGQKVHSLRQFINLPRLSNERFVLALAIHREETRDLAALEDNGWKLLDPSAVTASPSAYREFIQSSKAEFGVAKSGYVHSRCGWFSDRSVCYLASARPVIAQETGFSSFLPVGEGLFAFETAADVLASVEMMNRDYEKHRRAARTIAEEYFDSDKVLGGLLRQLGVA
ncbi:MAG: hypothetical protein M3362_05630 [Acidobacteriota bacterium]|nr:hypothetical protein [Acidobacteriota bacterium]